MIDCVAQRALQDDFDDIFPVPRSKRVNSPVWSDQIKTERLFFVKKRRSVDLIETYEPMAQASITGVI